MKKIQKIFIAVAALLAIGDVTFAAKKRPVLRVGSSSGDARDFDGNVGVAKELKLIEAELDKIGWDVEYTTFENGIEVNEAIISGDIDVSIIGDVPGFTGFGNAIGSVWIGSTLKTFDLAIITAKNSAIKSPKDLEGKTVSYKIGTVNHFGFENFAKGNNLNRESIKIANLNGPNALAALFSGELAAVSANASFCLPYVTTGEADLLFNSKDKPEWGSQLQLIARQKFVKKNREAVVAFEKALIKAREEVIKNPEKYYVQISAKRIAKTPEIGAELYNIDNGKFYNLVPNITEELIAKGQTLYDFFYDLGRIQKKKDVHAFADNSFYEQAAKELKAEGFRITE
ncbi:MAG: ABC transporter substrate-binding protein [Treponema sp.]|nr:ABC transporter substrate-binding protein [Treponema sp.]